jgi:hypothetical protein
MEQDGESTAQRHGVASLIPALTAASGSLSCERTDGKMYRSEGIDDVAYRLRCETKRTDLPAGVVQNYADAYLAITILQRHIKDLKEGFEGSCTACEPVGEMNKTLLAERDEARRLYCEEWAFTIELERGEAARPVDLALEKGWDCFKEKTNG